MGEIKILNVNEFRSQNKCCIFSVIEMIAMKNDLTVEEVEKINEVLPVPAIIQTRPEILVEEALALKANMTIGN